MGGVRTHGVWSGASFIGQTTCPLRASVSPSVGPGIEEERFLGPQVESVKQSTCGADTARGKRGVLQGLLALLVVVFDCVLLFH